MLQTEPSPDSTRQETAKKYARLTRRLFFVQLAIIGVSLLVLVFGGLSAKLSYFLAFPQPWASASYLLTLIIGYGLITSPLSYYEGFILPHRYGLSNQRFKPWLADRAKASTLGILLALGIVIVIYLLIEHLTNTWWLWAGVFVTLLSLLLTRLTPTLLLSLFFKLEPLEDTELREKLVNLAKSARTQVCDVFTMDLSHKGTTANAMLAGLGGTKRIIISDTLLQQYSPEEIEIILAHELGHHLHHDIPKLIGVQAIMSLLAFYLANLVLEASLIPLAFQGIGDITAFPLLILVLATFALSMMPLTNAYSRHLETMADETALQLTANPKAFITAMTKLTDQNLSEAQPSQWVELLFYDHPPYTKRIKLAHHYLQIAT